MRAVGVQYLDIASSHLDIALPHLDIALSHPLRSAVVLLLQLNNLSNHLATGNKCEIQVECDGIFAGVILIYCNTNPSTYILVFSCCAGTREQVTTVMYRATALLITTDGKGPCSLDVVANW